MDNVFDFLSGISVEDYLNVEMTNKFSTVHIQVFLHVIDSF